MLFLLKLTATCVILRTNSYNFVQRIRHMTKTFKYKENLTNEQHEPHKKQAAHPGTR
jgi:hypothetical protein